MLPSSALYKRAILRPHQRFFQVDLYSGTGALLENEVPVYGGNIAANLQQRVTRSGSFALSADFWPGDNPLASLTPYQTVARIRAGIRYGNGSTESFPLIEGRVGHVQREADGTVSARVDDRAADVVGLPFEQPRNSENVLITEQIRRLIQEALPGAVFGANDVDDALTPKLTWDEDRGKALDDLAEAVGGRWYQLGDGSFVVRRMAYDVGTPVQEVRDEEEGGLMLSGVPQISRDGAANSITVVVERADGSAPFRVTARDTAPSSPTRWDGPFGRAAQVIKVQTPLTEGEALTYARAQLSAATALAAPWSFSMIPDYTLEPADTVRVRSRGVRSTQLIDAITYPLNQRDAMTVSSRAYVRAPATVQ